MKKYSLLLWGLLLFMLWPSGLTAQKTIVFLGRLVDAQTQRGVPGVAVRVLGAADALSQNDGLFRIALPANTSELKLEIDPAWEIRYPVGGRAAVPRQADQVIDFLVQRAQPKENPLQGQLNRLRRSGRLKDAQLDSLRRQLETLQQKESGRQASVEQLAARLQVLSDSLERVYLRRNRAEVYTQVSSELLAFLDRSKDLRDELGRVRDAFLHPSAMDQFNAVVERYNKARNLLYDQHQGRQEQVRLFWETPSLDTALQSVYQYALQDVHTQIVLPLNQSVGEPLRQVATGRSSRMAVQSKAVKSASTAAGQLSAALQELERRLAQLQQIWPKN